MMSTATRTMGLVAALFVGSLKAADQVDEILLHKEGVRVAFVYKKANEVGYLPGRIISVDAKGEPSAALAFNPAGKEGHLLSGRLTLTADEKGLTALKNKAESGLGSGVKLTAVKLSSFQMWMLVGEKVVWERPPGDGSTKAIPVFGVVPTASTRPDKARLLISLNWTETIPPSKATLLVDWQAILKELETELSAKTPLTEEKLILLAGRVLARGGLRVERGGESDKPPADEILNSVLVQMIRKNLLRAPEPVPSPMGGTGQYKDKDKPTPSNEWSISYRLRKDIRTEKLETKFDLSVATQVERVTTFETSIPLAGQ